MGMEYKIISACLLEKTKSFYFQYVQALRHSYLETIRKKEIEIGDSKI
jgi:hypothetical protein